MTSARTARASPPRARMLATTAVRRGLVQVGDDDARALAGEAQGQRPADAAAPAGDDGPRSRNDSMRLILHGATGVRR